MQQRMESVVRVTAAAGLATGSAWVSSDWTERSNGSLVVLVLVSFLMLVGCVSLVIDETVVRVKRAIDLAYSRGNDRRAYSRGNDRRG